MIFPLQIAGAAGNFLCPAAGMSFNAFKTVIDIDTIGTFNTSKAVFDEYMKVWMQWQIKQWNLAIKRSTTKIYRYMISN